MSLRSMKASVTAGLKCDPEMRALKIRRMKNPTKSPVPSPDWKQELYSEVSRSVPKNSKRRIRMDSLSVVRRS